MNKNHNQKPGNLPQKTYLEPSLYRDSQAIALTDLAPAHHPRARSI